jgi:hypothetical protein
MSTTKRKQRRAEKLYISRLTLYRIKIKTTDKKIMDYYVKAPTKCSATKHTALRNEVEDILHLTEYTTLEAKEFDDKNLTFYTFENCP